MSIACVLITHLPAKVELRRRPHLADVPAVIVDRSGRRPMVVDRFPAADRVPLGAPVEEALSLHAGAVVIEADEPAYRAAFQRVLTALQGVSDRVEEAELGTAYVGLDGLQEMYGGEARLVSALLSAAPGDLAPRIGVAQGKFPAMVAASRSAPMGATRVSQDAAAFLSPHPIGLLPVAAETREALACFGLRTLGDVAAMARETLVDQFGTEGGLAWDLARGVDASPLRPLRYEEVVEERTALPVEAASLELLVTAVDALLRRAYARPRMRGRYAGRAALACSLANAPPWERVFHFKRGVGDWRQASGLLRPRLEMDYPQSPVEEAVLTLGGLTGETGVQGGLLPDIRADREGRLAEAERRLQPHMGGSQALYRVAAVAPDHPAPELRSVQVPIDPGGRNALKPLGVPVAVAVREGHGRTPAAVEVGGRWQRVAGIDDQWTFDLWWMPQPMERDYYRVSGEDGRQMTLFRDRHGDCWYRQNA